MILLSPCYVLFAPIDMSLSSHSSFYVIPLVLLVPFTLLDPPQPGYSPLVYPLTSLVVPSVPATTGCPLPMQHDKQDRLSGGAPHVHAAEGGSPRTATDGPRYSVAGNHWLDTLPLLMSRDSVNALVTRAVERHQFSWCSVSCLTALLQDRSMRDLVM